MIYSEKLLEDLCQQTYQHIQQAEDFLQLTTDELHWRSHVHAWNILECIEHLNLYGDYYLAEISAKIDDSKTQSKAIFVAGFWGDYFAKSMLPGDKMLKMRTFKSKNPFNYTLNRSVIDRFIQQQQVLLGLLQKSKNVDLNTVKIKTTLSFLFRIKLGDALRFVINHNTRHMVQAYNVLKNYKESVQP